MAAEQLDDSSVISRIKAYSNTFKYHQKPKACYSTYILKSKRSVKTKSEPELDSKEVEEGESSDHYKAPKRRKAMVGHWCHKSMFYASSVLRVKAMLLRVKQSVLRVKPFVLRVKRCHIYKRNL